MQNEAIPVFEDASEQAEQTPINSPLDAFYGAISRPQLSFFYRLGLVLVALTMIILPVIYVAFIVLAGCGVYYFAMHCFAAIWDWPIGHSKYSLLVKVVCSCTPLFAGGIMTFFMVKPLFARRQQQMQPYALNPNDEPLLYAFIQRICQIVGAPVPKRIQFACDINASAGFRRGLLSFFGNDLVLTIGMPLVAGLTMQEFAGVIAHEFGHFTQGAGMRLNYLVRRVNFWFVRVIFQRDSWDAWLAELAQSEAGWLKFMVTCAQFAVWCSRLILRLLMLLGHAISSFLMRQMEFDADRYEIKMAGSAAFESTSVKLAVMNHVQRDIYLTLQRSWRNSFQLVDNLPLFIGFRAEHLPAERWEKIASTLGLEKTGWLDTHPSTADRVRQARVAGELGIFQLTEPAKNLFHNFDTISRFVTLAHYEDDLNVPTTPDFLIPVETVIGSAPAAAE